MSDAPERITARYYATGIINARRAGEDWAFSLGNALGQAEYIVTDLSDALTAAAYEAAAARADNFGPDYIKPEFWPRHIADTIRTLIPAEAQAALDARDARIRREERERCAQKVESLWAYRTCQEVADAIRAMGDE